MTVRQLIEALEKMPLDKEVRMLVAAGCCLPDISVVYFDRNFKLYDSKNRLLDTGVVMLEER